MPQLQAQTPAQATAHTTPLLLHTAPEHAVAPAEVVDVNQQWTNPVDLLPAVLADLPDGRRIARRVIPGHYGKSVALYWLVDPTEPDRRPEQLNGHEDLLVRPHMMLDQLRSCSPNGQPGYITPTPLEVEVSGFAKAYPCIAHHLGLTKLAPQRAFDPRVCYRPAPGPNSPKYDPAKTGEFDLAAFRDRHVSGDFGIHGLLADAAPLDPVTLWMIGLAPALTRNAEALQSGRGAIRSDYEFTGPQGHKVTVTAITALLADPRANFTVFGVATSPQPVASPSR
jgi:hypothetical protein